jgi:hypothetical protein
MLEKSSPRAWGDREPPVTDGSACDLRAAAQAVDPARQLTCLVPVAPSPTPARRHPSGNSISEMRSGEGHRVPRLSHRDLIQSHACHSEWFPQKPPRKAAGAGVKLCPVVSPARDLIQSHACHSEWFPQKRPREAAGAGVGLSVPCLPVPRGTGPDLQIAIPSVFAEKIDLRNATRRRLGYRST